MRPRFAGRPPECGCTTGASSTFAFEPEDCGLKRHDPQALMPDADKQSAAVKMYQLLAGRGEAARLDAVILNAALLFFVQGMVLTIAEGVERAREILFSGEALVTLRAWVEVQNSDPSVGCARLAALARVGR